MMTNPFSKFLQPRQEPGETELVFVILPGAIEPDDRESRFSQPLDAELRLAGIGYVSGGGTLLGEPDEDDECEVLYAGVDVDATDVEAARILLRDHLPYLGCPPNTKVQYGGRQDRYDSECWFMDEPRDE